MRHIDPAGLQIIKDSEALRLIAYLCPAKIPTIGYGHTGPDVKLGDRITVGRANELLALDLARFERGVDAEAGKATDNQFSAMVSLAFNIGLGAFAKSSVLRFHQAGDYGAAANAFRLWNKGGGRVLPGLVKRREREANLYRSA